MQPETLTLTKIALGNYFAWNNDTTPPLEERISKLLKPAKNEKISDDDPTNVKIKQTKDNDGDVVFVCTNVSIDDAVTDQLQEIDNQLNELNKLAPTQVGTAKEPSQKAQQYHYDIQIHLHKKPNTTKLADLYFSDWQQNNFEVIVTHAGEPTRLDPTTKKYKDVVQTIQLLLPKATLLQKDPNAYVSDIGDELGIIKLGDTQDDPIISNKFIEKLLPLAIGKAKDDNFNLVDNYFSALEQRNKSILFSVKKKHLEILKEKKNQEATLRKVERRSKVSKVAVPIVTTTIATLTVVIIAGLIALTVFVPPAGAIVSAAFAATTTVAGGIFLSIIKAALSTITSQLVSAGVILAGAGAIRVSWEWLFGARGIKKAKTAIKEAEEQLIEIEKIEKAVEQELDKSSEKNGVRTAINAIKLGADEDIQTLKAEITLENIIMDPKI